MAIVSDCICLDIIAIFITVLVGIITYFKWSFKYWEKRNVPYVQPKIPFGTLANPLWKPESSAELIKRAYDEFKAKGCKHVGLFVMTCPVYMPIDTEYVKNIMAKDFGHFMDRGIYVNEKDDPLSAHLFSLEGTKWRNLRIKLTPTFTSGKMKMMFQTLVECGNQLEQAMDGICTKKEPVNIKEVLGCFTTDVIGSCAFGLDCNSFKDPNTEFRKHAKSVFNNSTIEVLKGFLGFAVPNLARSLGVTLTPTDAADFFMKISRETVAYREKNNIQRKDFMQLLVNLKNNVNIVDDEGHEVHANDGKSLTMEELAAQAFLFFIAGFETSSSTMAFCLYELAVNQDIQDKVRKEITSALDKHGGKITYDILMAMKYMGQVIDETLRKYPPVPMLNRKCIQEYQVPGTDVTIEKDTMAFIPVIAMHHDAEFFPNPEKFDPDRFSDENRGNITPYTYMPFGEGPRICIGLRFGVMQTKVGLAALLMNYRFTLNSKTQTPFKMNPFSFLLSPLGDIWLDAERIGA